MNNLVKTICMPLAFLVVLMPLISSLGVGMRRSYMKKQLHEIAELKATESFCLDEQNYKGLKSGDEIDYNHKRYDVKSVRAENGKLYVVVVNDKLEKALEKSGTDFGWPGHKKAGFKQILLDEFSIFSLAEIMITPELQYFEHHSGRLLPAMVLGVFQPPEC
jgi:hypothetical protein